MSTGTINPIGPAKINVILDTKAALKQLEDLERRLKTLPYVHDKIGMEDVSKNGKGEEERDKEKSESAKIKESVDKINRDAKTGRFGSTMAKAVAMAGTVSAIGIGVEMLGPAIGQGLKETFKGIPGLEDASDSVDAKLKKLSDELSEKIAYVAQTIPSANQTLDVVRARIAAGQQPQLGEAGDVFTALFKANTALEMGERQRRKMTSEFVGDSIGKFLNGGLRK